MISKAINDVIHQWIIKFEKRQQISAPNWSSIRGALKDIHTDSVELQHTTTRTRIGKG